MAEYVPMIADDFILDGQNALTIGRDGKILSREFAARF